MIVCKNCGTEIPSGYYHNCPVHFRTPAEAIKEAIAANNKWWEEKHNQVMDAKDDYYKNGIIPIRISDAIAANNAEWVERIERRVIEKCLSLELDNEHCLICYRAGICHIESWHQLKLSMQSSTALSNLMGKFPDLEVGQ